MVGDGVTRANEARTMSEGVMLSVMIGVYLLGSIVIDNEFQLMIGFIVFRNVIPRYISPTDNVSTTNADS